MVGSNQESKLGVLCVERYLYVGPLRYPKRELLLEVVSLQEGLGNRESRVSLEDPLVTYYSPEGLRMHSNLYDCQVFSGCNVT